MTADHPAVRDLIDLGFVVDAKADGSFVVTDPMGESRGRRALDDLPAMADRYRRNLERLAR